MVSSRGRGERVTRGEGHGGRGRPQCTYFKRIDHTHSLHGFLSKITNVSKAETVTPSSLRMNTDGTSD